MFTAVVLICFNGLKEPDNCYTFTNEVIHTNRAACEFAIEYALRNNIFTISDPETGFVEKPVDWYCINWNSVRVNYQ